MSSIFSLAYLSRGGEVSLGGIQSFGGPESMFGVRGDEGWGSRVDSNDWGEERVFVEVIACIADKRKAAVDMKEGAFVEGRQMVEVVEVVEN
jgi:hypothetical protein